MYRVTGSKRKKSQKISKIFQTVFRESDKKIGKNFEDVSELQYSINLTGRELTGDIPSRGAWHEGGTELNLENDHGCR